MIVTTMIAILMGIALFPYGYYMDRSRVEKNIDSISQEWILAHNDVKNGILYNPDSHAHLYLHFTIGAESVNIYMSTGGTSPEKFYKTLPLEQKIQIQSFSGIELGGTSEIIYHIEPPYGYGKFSTGGTEVSLTGITMTIGYPGASLASGRARQILLRPYY